MISNTLAPRTSSDAITAWMRQILLIDAAAALALFAIVPRHSADWMVGMTAIVAAVAFILSIVSIVFCLGFKLVCQGAASALEASNRESKLSKVLDPVAPAAATATFAATVGVIFFAVGMIAMCYSLIAAIVPGLGR